jgi:hypothetical protein
MAVGDVTVTMSASNTILTFQPAGANVFFINAVFSASGTMYSLYNGANVTQQGQGITNGIPRGFFVTNSIYLRIPAQGGADFSGFSAIQTK